MKPVSQDLRERIVTAYSAGDGSYEELGDRFPVSKSVVGKLVRQHREHGTLDTFVSRCGRKPAIFGKTADRLRKHLEKYPDATVPERRAALRLKCTEKTVWQTLRKIGWRYKKNQLGRQNKTGPTWR